MLDKTVKSAYCSDEMKQRISIQNCTCTYPLYDNHPTIRQQLPVLKQLDLEVNEGDCMLILGAPESGKSTLAKVIAGLLPKYSGGTVSGTITVGNMSITQEEPCNLVEHITLVFQNPDEEILMGSCEDEIAFPLEALGLKRADIQKKIDSALEFSGLEKYRNTSPGKLSGGEKKRLLLAVTYAIDAPFWILDETFEELDYSWRRQLAAYIKGSGKTVLILASKNIPVFDTFVKSWAYLAEGQLYVGSKDAVMKEFTSITGVFAEKNLTSVNRIKIDTSADALPDVEQEPSALNRIEISAGSSSSASTHEEGFFTSSHAKKAALSCKDISYQFFTREAVKHKAISFALSVDSFAVYPGEVTALLGPNGSGKSTLSKLLCGLLQPKTGGVYIGTDNLKAAPAQLKRYTGYVFQNPDYQIFLPTVLDELMLGLRNQGCSYHEALEKSRACAPLFGLQDLTATPATMSYGARKRLQAAIYYVLNRPVCIFDEVDSGLSLTQFYTILELFAKKGTAIILITHDQTIAEAAAKQIVTMEEGRIAGVTQR